MRTPIICAIILVVLCCFAVPYQAKADIIIADSLSYDNSTGVVRGYASTFLTYPERYYYDAGVSSVLADQYYNVRDQNSYLGGSAASVNTQTFGSPGMSFNLQSSHYLGFYFYYCDYECGYYDYYGYSLYGGEYPAYEDFSPNYTCYVFYDVYDFADTYLQITVPQPQCPSGLYVQLQSNRVGGVLNGTTQTALLGGTVNLQAVVTGASSGDYTWTVTGVAQQNISGSTANIYWKDTGMKTVRVDFTPSGANCQVSATVNINVILPTLDSFTGSQDSGETLIKVTFDNFCGDVLGTVFSLGCSNPATSEMYEPGTGINFVAQASAPQGLISDPSQSKIKFVQLVNSYRKRQVMGQQGYECESTRNRTPPWSIDSSDPYDSYIGRYYAVVDFATANPAIIKTGDNPAQYVYIEGAPPSYNYLYIDEQFEMYVVYFTTADPNIQIPLSRVRWNWGGEVVYDTTAPNNYRINSAFSTLGIHPSEAVNSFTPYSGTLTASDFQWLPCGGSGCDPDGSAQRACRRRGYKYEWDPDTCHCVYTGGL